MSTLWSLVLGVLLLAGNAFFVAAEFALLSSQRSRMEVLAQGGDRRARLVLDEMRHLTLMLAGTQLGITACSVGLGHVAEPAVASVLESALSAAVEIPDHLLHTIGFAVALLVVTSLHMVLGEMVPKNLAIAGPERAALWLGPPMALFTRLLRPFVWLLNGAANLVLRAFGITPQSEVKSSYTTGELADVLAESRAEGLLDPAEHRLLSGALSLDELTAARLMLPRERLYTLPADATLADLEDAVVRTGYSRYPLVRGTELVGFVHVKDLLGAEGRPGDAALPREWVRPMPVVGPELPVDELLGVLRARGTHLAVVVDDGRALGVVPLEHVLEAFVGEITDAVSERRPGHADRGPGA